MTGEFPEVVHDTNGSSYELDKVLGRGGQGAVLGVRGRDLAVKFLYGRSRSEQRRIRENIARVRRLPLDGLNVAKPLRALRGPHVGYVMDLMTGMMPLKQLIRVPDSYQDDFVPWYIESGSAFRRMKLLARVAELFNKLHSRGLAYGDASPDNIFVSENDDGFQVWLIDCDNIVHGVSPRTVYTPGYAAPELFNGHPGSDSLTDAWSLAMIVFETLTVLHPFDGDLVHDGEPALEEQAFQGKLPWVDDEEDSRNRASRGIPREMVLTSSLRRLAARCFGESRIQRECRPSVADWAEKLHAAADQMIRCDECQSSFFINQTECSWCGVPRPDFALANIYLRDPSLADDQRNPFQLVCSTAGRPTPVARSVIQSGRTTSLSARQLEGAGDDAPAIELELQEKVLVVNTVVGDNYELLHRKNQEVRPLQNRTERLDMRHNSTRWWLAPHSRGGLHRVVDFEYRPGRGL